MRYEYECPKCHGRVTLRRAVDDRNDPVDCLHCGKSMERVFTPLSVDIHVPMHFRQWLSNGAPGGGQYSHSDFHDKTEREMAQEKGVEMAPVNRARSAPGRGNR